jgi:ribokinase
MSARIAVVGSNMIDLITYVDRMPEAGETIEAPRFEMGYGGKGANQAVAAAPRFEMGYGGKGANQAVAAARLGSQVMMVARVGDDSFGKGYLENFRAQGIDVRHVTPAPGLSNGVAPIFVDPSGENWILIVKGANTQLSPADVDRAADELAGCDLILLQLEVPYETVYHTVELAVRLGKDVLLNPAPARPELDVKRLAGLTFLVPNQTELALLSGMPTGTVAQNEAAARSLQRRGIRTIIVTLGGDGALLVDGGSTRHVPPVKVKPVDTTGAGDAFIGSFGHFYAASRDVEGALRQAARYAAHSITRPGTQKSYATAAEFSAFCATLPEP